jgi:hypothetical protein
MLQELNPRPHPLVIAVSCYNNYLLALNTDCLSRSRLKSLEADTPAEDQPDEDFIPVNTWPSAGAVEITDVTVKYKLARSYQTIHALKLTCLPVQTQQP